MKDVSLSHSLPLASAYGTPEYTNFTQGFAGCLDYIFYQHDQLDIGQVSLVVNVCVSCCTSKIMCLKNWNITHDIIMWKHLCIYLSI